MERYIKFKIKTNIIFIILFLAAPQLQGFSWFSDLTPNEKLQKLLNTAPSSLKCPEYKKKLQKAFECIKQGANHNTQNAQNYTIFMLAVKQGFKDIAIELCQLEMVDVEQIPPYYENMLDFVIRNKQQQVALELLKNPKTKIGGCLFSAIYNKMPDLALELIKDSRTKLNRLSGPVFESQTILIEAMRCKTDERVIIALIEHPKTIMDARSLNGITGLLQFAKYYDLNGQKIAHDDITEDSAVKIVSMLLKRGACPFTEESIINASKFPKVQTILNQGKVAYNKANAAVFLCLAEKDRLKKLQQDHVGRLDVPVIYTKVIEYL